MKGYAGRLLEINLTEEKISETIVEDDVLRKYVGGRGLAAKILWDRLGKKWENVDPRGPENLLLFMTGPLTGYYPGGRLCVTGKSPQSNGITGSTIAGEFGIDLRCAGYDGIILSGRAKKPSYISVFDSETQIKSAEKIWGKEAKETLKTVLKDEMAYIRKKSPRKGLWKDPSILYIGPAGENIVRVACVCAKWTHAAGYGGYGAVMGAKNVKAISVKGSGPLPDVADPGRTEELIEHICQLSYQSEDFRSWGTGFGGYHFGNRMSSEPVRNWQDEWHDEKSFAVNEFEDRCWIKRYWGDFGCPTTCIKVSMLKTGPHKGTIGDNPDYELQAYNGTDLGIFTPEDNVYLAARMDELGLCGIQCGNVLGFAAELYQRKILTREDLDGFDLKWGNTEAFAKLADKIAHRRGIGRILAEGTYRAAKTLSQKKKQDLTKFAVQSKGIAIGAHGIRSGVDGTSGPVGYVYSVQGGDHTSPALLPWNSKEGDVMLAFYDSGVYCQFNTFRPELDDHFNLLNAVTGWNVTKEEWLNEMVLRILAIQRTTLLLGGPDASWTPMKDDVNPPRFYEPLPSGPHKGKTTKLETVREEMREYCKLAGWDENGIPAKQTLTTLGLADIDKVLDQKIRGK